MSASPPPSSLMVPMFQPTERTDAIARSLNVFDQKTFKDLAMASVRSVGWNIGTISELGGGLADIAGEGAKLARGERATLTRRASYVAMLPITVGMYGALYQYLRTGEG